MSDFSNVAPLSRAQTLAISKHLQDQLTAVQGKLEDLQLGLSDTNRSVDGLRKGVHGTKSDVHSLQDGLALTSSTLEATRKDLGRTCEQVQKLQAGLDESNDTVGAWADKSRIMGTTMQQFGQDLSNTNALAKRLEEAVDRRIEGTLQGLRDDLHGACADLQQLRADGEMGKAALQEEREALRETNAKVKGLTDSTSDDSTATLKATRLNLEDLNTATLKLHEDHESTKSHSKELQNTVRKLAGHTKQANERLQQHAANFGQTKSKQDEHSRSLEGMRQSMLQAQGAVEALQMDNQRSALTVSNIQHELSEMRTATHALKVGLKETSSLLLPNIRMDSDEMTSAICEGLLAGTPTPGQQATAGPSSAGVSRRPSSRSHHRNIGSHGGHTSA
eukprot:CAMPEP_0179371334 /NCGR_PEP_ID=MMETSP0797-20121207/85674_1 /TAXON_ID=47934 /ORGANISM="Dinophysis acuminata, Strain DAEP01" /LENGTH=390 /DNA_ID=CAMNT_0021087187 /DNA_START=57 /DNA_END=1226 /DNA_ORIENTATION=-